MPEASRDSSLGTLAKKYALFLDDTTRIRNPSQDTDLSTIAVGCAYVFCSPDQHIPSIYDY
jgi:hypothetical protein